MGMHLFINYALLLSELTNCYNSGKLITLTKTFPPTDSMTAKLSYLQRAQLYTQLAALNRAGIAAAQSWRMLDLGPEWQAQIAQVRRALEHGLDVAGAGERAGILLPLDAAVIRATQLQGDLSPAYQRLGNYYQLRARQWQAIRARLLMPTLMLGLALLLQALPQLILGQISVLAYFANLILTFASLGAFIVAGKFCLSQFQASRPSAQRAPLDRLLLHLPVFGVLHQRRCLADFWHALAMLLEAGVPMFEAFRQALALVNNGHLQSALLPVAEAMEQGRSFTDALIFCELFRQDKLVRGLVNSGEASGSLPEMLTRLANAQDEALASAQEQLSIVLPRLAYVAVAAWMAYSLLRGGSTTLPPAL